MYRNPIVPDGRPRWRDSRYVCALSDADRHLGHIVLKAGLWCCFDATHLNDARNDFKHLGTFHNIHAAKAAVEDSCATVCNWRGPGLSFLT